jgi:hypothetical protein
MPPSPFDNRPRTVAGSPRRRFGRLRGLARVLAWVVLVPASIWAVAALYFDLPVAGLRVPLATLYGLGVVAVWIRARRPWKLIITAAAFAGVLAWWFSLRPSNDRNWLPDLAVLPWAEISGSRVTIHHIRHCEYRTETDFDVRHYDRTFDLDRLRTADLFLVYWGSPHIAHTMMSFGFDGGEHVCISIETRKEKGESYSAVKGFFRQFELAYVIADERDVVRLRTNFRQGEEVYLYRLRSTPAGARQLLLEYLARANHLREHPEWYNAVTDNCTTGIRMQRTAADRIPWDWRLLANGHGDALLYERGLIATDLPLAALKERSHINARAKTAPPDETFSQRIREGVPAATRPE